MKVLLIVPPINNMICSYSPAFLDEERGYNPSLGLMYIAAYAEKHTNHDIKILDTQVLKMYYQDIENAIKRLKPDIVGIQAMTFTIIDVLLVARVVKKIDINIKVVLGGPHVNIFYKETIAMPEVDYIILGEGEFAFTEFLNNFEDRLKLKRT